MIFITSEALIRNGIITYLYLWQENYFSIHSGHVEMQSTENPPWLTKSEIKDLGVPVQLMAPDIDPVFTPKLEEFSNRAIPSLGLDYDYLVFPGLEHVFAVRRNRANEAKIKGLGRAKNAAMCRVSSLS